MNEYKTHDQFVDWLKQNKAEECERVIKSYNNMICLNAVLCGACCIIFIVTMLRGADMNIVGNSAKMLTGVLITVLVGGITNRFIVGKQYYDYLKQNNIVITEDKQG